MPGTGDNTVKPSKPVPNKSIPNKSIPSKPVPKKPLYKKPNVKPRPGNGDFKGKKLHAGSRDERKLVSMKILESGIFPFDLYTTRPLIAGVKPKGSPKHRKNVEIPKFMLKKKLRVLPKHFEQNKWDLENQEKLKQIEATRKRTNVTTQGLYDEFRAKRDVERKKAEQLKLVDKADTSKHLTEAIDFQGSCLEMCPVFERIRRELENNVSALEKENGVISSAKAIKAFARPAASAPPPLPSDVRPPHILVKTLNYMVDNVLQTLPENEPFIWDRTRSIRQDFTLQNYFGPECVDCCEKIVRIHLLTIHVMIKNSCEFSKQQELEQMNKSIVTLCEIYDEGRKMGIRYPNEAEIRSYWCLLNPRDPELDNQVQLLPKEILNDNNFQLSLTFRRLMSNSFFKERGHKPVSNGLNLTSTFFKLIEREGTPFLLSCFLETFMNEIRFYGILKLKQTWSKKVTNSLSFDVLIDLFKFNSDQEVVEICEYYSIVVHKEARTLDLTSLTHEAHLLPEKTPLRDFFLQGIENKLLKYSGYTDIINSGEANNFKFNLKKAVPLEKKPTTKEIKTGLTNKNHAMVKENGSTNAPKPQFSDSNQPKVALSHNLAATEVVTSQIEDIKPSHINLRTTNNETNGISKEKKSHEKQGSLEKAEQEISISKGPRNGTNNLQFSFGSKPTANLPFNNQEAFSKDSVFVKKNLSIPTNKKLVSNKNEDLGGISSTQETTSFKTVSPAKTSSQEPEGVKKLSATSFITDNRFALPFTETPDKPLKPLTNPEVPKKQHSDSPIADPSLIKKITYKIVYNDILSDTSELILEDILLNSLLRKVFNETKAKRHYEKNLKKKCLSWFITKHSEKQLNQLREAQMEKSIRLTKNLISDANKRKISLNDFLNHQTPSKYNSSLKLTPLKNEKRTLKITRDLIEKTKSNNILKYYMNHINYNIKNNNNFNKFSCVELNWLVDTENWTDPSIKAILKVIGINQIPFLLEQNTLKMNILRYQPELNNKDVQLLIFNTGVTKSGIFDIDDYMAAENARLKQILHSLSQNNNFKIDILIFYWCSPNSSIFDTSSLYQYSIVNSIEIIKISNESFIDSLKLAMNSISTKFRFSLNGQIGETFLHSKLNDLLKTNIVGKSPIFDHLSTDFVNERLASVNRELLETDPENDSNGDQYFLIDENHRKRKLAVANSVRKKRNFSQVPKNYNFLSQSNNSSNSTFESPPPNIVTSKRGIPTLVIDNTNNQRKSTFNHKNKRLITPIASHGINGNDEANNLDVRVSTPSTSAIGSILQFIKTPIRKIKN